jgi:molecular chaperone GrpE
MEEKNEKLHEEMVLEDAPDALEETLELEEEEELSQERIKKLRAKLRACEAEKQEHLDGWQRSRADFLNYKRRAEEEGKRREEVSTAHSIETLLPLLDSFTLATKGKAWDEADAGFKAGFQMIQSQLTSILKELGAESIIPTGEVFNPHEHEAIAEVEVDDEQEHIIIETVQPGYKIGSSTVRVARVVVGKKRS